MQQQQKKIATKSISLSFSGAGHLLTYHLGVSLAILNHIHLTENVKRVITAKKRKGTEKTPSNNAIESHFRSLSKSKPLPPIKSVAGSSSGAIAAVIFTKLPHRLDEYAQEFIETRGKAFEILSTMLLDEERHWSTNITKDDVGNRNNFGSDTIVSVDPSKRKYAPSLYVAATRCKDGSSHFFRFNTNDMYSTISSSWNTDSILEAVKASCTIPPSFHPFDIFPGVFVDQVTYPDEEGIQIEGKYYVDGGISSPAPIIPSLDGSSKHVIVSPISYGRKNKFTEDKFYRISPNDNSLKLLPIQNIKCRSEFLVKPSLQNLRSLRVAGGMASTDELREWYVRGIEDGNTTIQAWKDKNIF